MSFTRATFGAMRTASTSIGGARSQLFHFSTRRGYPSNQGSNASKTGSNFQWVVGAAAVTIPIYWYFFKSTPQEKHHISPSQKSAPNEKPVEPHETGVASEPPGDLTTQFGKQEKLTNEDTRHPRDIGRNSPFGQKGEDTPESAKIKGTVGLRGQGVKWAGRGHDERLLPRQEP